MDDRVAIVGYIPDNVWDALTIKEKNTLFIIQEAMDNKFDIQEMRQRLDNIKYFVMYKRKLG